MGTEEILDAVGGLSWFQFLLMVILRGPRICLAWGMLMMSFAGVPPDDWRCSEDLKDVPTNTTIFNACPINSDNCTYVYSHEKHTVIDEWDLVCEKKSIKNMIISIQMGGVLVGCLLSGQSSDGIGRKKTFILALVLHGGFNLVTAFSTSWQMFAVCRFFIGSMVGASLAVSFPYAMEFVAQKWRHIAIIVPTWQLGTCLFALAAWLRPNWSHLHIILAALHVPFFFGFCFVPESLRWLAVHGRLEEAEKVVDQIARYNKREKPANTAQILKDLAEEETTCQAANHKYTYLDIYRPWNICYKTLIIQFVWASMSFVFYGISFGVGKLHGNLYLNIFLMAIVGVPGSFVVFAINNRLGRRWTSFIFFGIASVSAFGVVIASRYVTEDNGLGLLVTGLAMLCKMGVSAAWSAFAIPTSELYPTPIRNLGYGAASSSARIGSIASGYAFAVGGKDLLIPFVIVGSLMGVSGGLCFLLPETVGQPLPDTTKAIVQKSVDDTKL